MTPDQASNAVVSWIGIVLQFAGSVLCLGLGLILRRNQGERRWLTCWVASFAAMAVAIGALLVRYYLLPLVPLGSLPVPQTQVVAVLYAVYLTAKLGFLFCLMTGTWLFVTRRPVPRAAMAAGAATILLAGLAVLLIPTDLDPLMGVQAGFAVPVFLACAWMLSHQPVARRTRGSRLLAGVCLMLSVLWLLYVPGFVFLPKGAGGAVAGFLQALTFHNSYVDLLFEFLLGFGMILAVLDDAFLAAEEARAARLREVAASEARLAQIIRAASEGIVLLDASRRIMHCNPAALEILGCAETEVLGASFDRFLTTGSPDDFWSSAGEGVQRTATTPPGGHEVRGVRCDGREFPMEISRRSIGDGTPTGFVLIVRDRTERVRFEEERERTRTQVDQTARLETIGRMVSGVAHELNNPLTAILAFAQDLLGQSRSLTDTEALTTIVQQSQRCRSIVLDLLTFARSRREDRERISPLAIVRRVLPAIERQAAARDVRLEVEASPDLPLLEASPSGMEQVLTNLVVNAIQAVRVGGRVAVRARVLDDSLWLVVEDDGPGIPADVMPRLFEPFFTTKGPGEGTGLGLSVSHAIVEQHGGSLTAENRTPGDRGARFTVRLPYLDRRAASRTTPDLPRAAASPGEAGAARAPRRVLVVDDEGPIRVAIRRYLERRGWTVQEARDGREALELLGLDEGGRVRTELYDAIVTDLKMPGLSGIDLHDRLAAISPESVAKLVMITGDTASPDAAEFFDRLRQPLIQKPFDMRALADLLDRIAPVRAAAVPPVS
jgi:PAS domain S-box-containing protein